MSAGDARAASAEPWDWLIWSEGWPLQSAFMWLAGEGRFAVGLGALSEGLGRRLVESGAPVVRVRLASLTLHPMLSAWDGTWHVRDGAKQQEFPANLLQTSTFIGSPVQLMMESQKPYRRRLDQPLGADDHVLLYELQAEALTDYLVVPLFDHMGILGYIPRFNRQGILGYLSFTTDRPRGFDDADIGKLTTLGPFVAQAVDVINRERIAATLLDTYIGRRAGGRVLAGNIRRGDSEKIRAALWYSDLRDFTRLNEELTPETMVAILNTYCGIVGDAIMARGGEVLQFIGDAVLAIFECETDPGDTRRACRAALDAAGAALAAVDAYNRDRQPATMPPIRFGIGLHVGDVTFGNVGAEARLGFNVVGPAVNLTARLETLSKEIGTPLAMSSAFAGVIGDGVRRVGTYALKGVREMQEVFSAADLVAETAK